MIHLLVLAIDQLAPTIEVSSVIPTGYYVVQGVNITALAAFAYALLKIAVPVGLSVRDSLRDTTNELKELRRTKDDHESRLRTIEHGDRGDFTERRRTSRHQ